MLEIIIMTMKSFSLYENAIIRRHVPLNGISVEILQIYMDRLTCFVRKRIWKCERIALSFDVWTYEDTHFTVISAFFQRKKNFMTPPYRSWP